MTTNRFSVAPDTSLRIEARLRRLGLCSEEPDALTRTFGSPAWLQARELLCDWMLEAGLTVSVDGFGNVIGRRSGGRPGEPVTIVGSHYDTVRRAGRYDGALGVIVGIELAAQLRDVPLASTLAVVAFAEEEGVRFNTAYLGSKGFCGRLTPADLLCRDDQGTTLGEALSAGHGGRFVAPITHGLSEGVAAYLEVHLEQGPVLERLGQPLGVVTAIAGQSRTEFLWTGRAAHAGTTPMAGRRDALVGAARFVIAVQQVAGGVPGAVATVGELRVDSGVANVVPGAVSHTLDVRHADDAVRAALEKQLFDAAEAIAMEAGLGCVWQTRQAHRSTPCDPALTQKLAAAVRAQTGAAPALASGAGHDAVILAGVAPVAMLFVRCRDGVSHHPDEFVAPEDSLAALRVLMALFQGGEVP